MTVKRVVRWIETYPDGFRWNTVKAGIGADYDPEDFDSQTTAGDERVFDERRIASVRNAIIDVNILISYKFNRLAESWHYDGNKASTRFQSGKLAGSVTIETDDTELAHRCHQVLEVLASILTTSTDPVIARGPSV